MKRVVCTLGSALLAGTLTYVLHLNLLCAVLLGISVGLAGFAVASVWEDC